jgi:hypothetical protein
MGVQQLQLCKQKQQQGINTRATQLSTTSSSALRCCPSLDLSPKFTTLRQRASRHTAALWHDSHPRTGRTQTREWYFQRSAQHLWHLHDLEAEVRVTWTCTAVAHTAYAGMKHYIDSC